MQRVKVIIAGLIFLGLAAAIVYPWVDLWLNPFGKIYTIEEFTDNFDDKQNEIHDLANYSNTLVKQGAKAKFEYNKDGEFLITYRSNNDVWVVGENDSRYDSLIQTVGWSNNQLKRVKTLLDKANCIEIETGNPCNITYRFSGFARLSYNIFEEPLPLNEAAFYNNGCRYIYYGPKVVLEYRGGAIGPQCFPH